MTSLFGRRHRACSPWCAAKARVAALLVRRGAAVIPPGRGQRANEGGWRQRRRRNPLLPARRGLRSGAGNITPRVAAPCSRFVRDGRGKRGSRRPHWSCLRSYRSCCPQNKLPMCLARHRPPTTTDRFHCYQAEPLSDPEPSRGVGPVVLGSTRSFFFGRLSLFSPADGFRGETDPARCASPASRDKKRSGC